jgi:uncharacterized protein (TIGR03067 family)
MGTPSSLISTCKDETLEHDLKQLQGVWNVISLDTGDRTLSGAALSGARIVIQGERFTTSGMGATYEGSVTVDSEASPRSIDLRFTSGPETGNTNRGIYELDGHTWRICLSTRTSDRPTTFAADAASGIVLEVLERGSAEQSDVQTFDFAKMTLTPAAELQGQWTMVSGSLDGQPLDKGMVRMGRRTVEGNDMTVTFGREVYSKGKYSVDSSKSPATIDIYNTGGANAGKVQYGIYALQGNALTLSLAAPGSERPVDWTSTAGDGRTVVVWTRSKTSK